jgi:hypothetical protein
MTKEEFAKEVEKLRNVWRLSYPDERMNVIWKEVRGIESWEWKAMVDRVLGSFKSAPLAKDFASLVSGLRSQKYNVSKMNEAEDIAAFYSIPKEVGQKRLRFIMDRVNGKVSDEDFEEFKRRLKDAEANVGPSKS